MDNQTISKLLLIASVGLTLAGILFLCFSIFTEPKNTTYLSIALGSILLANLFNLIRAQNSKRKK